MNWVVIILGIVLVILVYVLYKYFTVTASTLVKTANLNQSIPPITSITSPKNVSYAYGVWIYVNTWDKNAAKQIFSRDKNIRLSLDNTVPMLKCDIYMTNDTWQTIQITDNFPIQKWVYITISVNNQFIDCYLDGKLIVARRVATLDSTGNVVNTPATPPDNSVAAAGSVAAVSGQPIILGNAVPTTGSTATFDAYISNFNRWTNELDPQTVWNTYLQGNGMSKTSSMSSYGVNMTILQDSVEKGTYALL